MTQSSRDLVNKISSVWILSWSVEYPPPDPLILDSSAHVLTPPPDVRVRNTSVAVIVLVSNWCVVILNYLRKVRFKVGGDSERNWSDDVYGIVYIRSYNEGSLVAQPFLHQNYSCQEKTEKVMMQPHGHLKLK